MTILGFVRHGVTNWNKEGRAQGQTDIPLNEAGKGQAKALAQRVVDEHWDVIYASDLSRAAETARIINEHIGVKIIHDERLREVHSGQIEGTTEAERVGRWGSDWFTKDLGKEPEETVLKRANSFIQDIVAKHPQKRVLIVSHGAFIGITLKHLIPLEDTSSRLHNSSMTLVKLTGEVWDCDLYNCIKHLETLT